MARKDRRGSPATIGELIAKVLPAHGPDGSAEILIYTWWRGAVPTRVAKSARPARVRNGVLTIHTSTSAWASEIDLMKAELLRSLAARHPSLGIKTLRAKVAPLTTPPMRARARALPPPPEPLSEVPEEIARVLCRVNNDQLRDAISEAARSALAPRTHPLPPLPKPVKRRWQKT